MTTKLIETLEYNPNYCDSTNYHVLQAQQSNYHVSPFDNEKGYSNGYYTTDSIDKVHHANGYKVIDCKWNQSEWHIKPLEMFFIPLFDLIRLEYYAERSTLPTEYGYNKELIGVMVNGLWQYKLVTINRSKHSKEYLTCDFENGSIRISGKAGRFGKNSNGYYETVGAFEGVKTVQLKKPHNDQIDNVKWFIDKLSHNKYKGFYDDVIDVLKGF